MFNQTIEKTRELLFDAKQISIVVGENPSVDSMAAGLSLYLSFKMNNKKVSITSPTPPTVELANLVGINEVKTNNAVSSNANGLIISLPYQQGAIEKISYDIVGERINLTVVPGPQGLNFTTEDIMYQTPSEASADLIFAVGSRLQDTVSPNTPVITIDDGEDSSYSSMSEMAAKLLLSLDVPIDVDIAQNLLSGIVDRTQNFQDPYTSPFAFEAASFLIQNGARRTAANSTPRGTVSQLRVDQSLKQTDLRTQKHKKTFVQGPVQAQEDLLQDSLGGAKRVTNAGPTPKDWFEPKIYKGSTQV